eukprot:3002906-Prymnesium_polylepis.1
MPLSAGWRGWRGAVRRSAVHAERAGEAAGVAQAQRLVLRGGVTLHRHGRRVAIEWVPRRRRRTGNLGFVQADPAMKDGRAIVWEYVRHERHVCTVGDRVWGPRFAFA